MQEFGSKAHSNIDLECLAYVEDGEVACDGELGIAPIVFEDYPAISHARFEIDCQTSGATGAGCERSWEQRAAVRTRAADETGNKQ